jgi:hypothetical protein
MLVLVHLYALLYSFRAGNVVFCVQEIMLIVPNYLTGEDISAVVVVMLIHFTAKAVCSVRRIVICLWQLREYSRRL